MTNTTTSSVPQHLAPILSIIGGRIAPRNRWPFMLHIAAPVIKNPGSIDDFLAQSTIGTAPKPADVIAICEGDYRFELGGAVRSVHLTPRGMDEYTDPDLPLKLRQDYANLGYGLNAPGSMRELDFETMTRLARLSGASFFCRNVLDFGEFAGQRRVAVIFYENVDDK